MNCPVCRHANRLGRRFCGACGAPLALTCPSCSSENEPDESYCGRCGGPLLPSSSAAPAPEPDAERRQITVVFCDLIESTPLSQRIDPEELRDLIRAYHQSSATIVEQFDGHIAQYLGDGMLIYFGYPIAHEDDPRRAVDAALAIIQAMEPLNARLQSSESLAVRIGIHTGLVVVGEIGGGARREHLALGETPNLAARLQTMASANSVVVSAATSRLIQGFFDCEPLGSQVLKGIAQPVEVFRVLQRTTASGRLDVQTAPTPFVDRTRELATLLELWQQAVAGASRVAILTGEPGIGKSRLVYTLAERIAGTTHVRIELRCSELHQHSARYPLIRHLERLLRFQPGESPEMRLEKLRSALTTYGLPVDEFLPLLATLLSLPLADGRDQPQPLSPELQKQRTNDALAAWLIAEARRQPVLLIIEDLHWIDPSTLEILGALADGVQPYPLMAVMTSRPDLPPPWPAQGHVHHLRLDHLGEEESHRLVIEAAAGKPLPDAVHDLIVAKTDGVPLFLEEMTRMAVESGRFEERNGHGEMGGAAPDLEIPETLQDLLMARLDRVAEVKEVAQIGAVIGRDFSDELLRAIAPMDERRVRSGLTRSVATGVLDIRSQPPTVHYTFRHGLIQQAAYQSLLRSRRREYHARTGQTLESRYPEIAAGQPEVIAHHYTEAGRTLQAIQYWQRAGRLAISRSAVQEAVHHLQRALSLVLELPDSPERAQLELGIQVARGSALMTTRGYAAPEVGEAFARGRELAAQVEHATQHFEVFTGLSAFYSVRAEYDTALELAQLAFDIAESEAGRSYRARARIILGQILMFRGDLEQARRRLSEGLALSPRRSLRSSQGIAAPDAQVVGSAFLSQTLWLLGYPDQALVHADAARAQAEEMQHAHSRAFALTNSAVIHAERGDLASARADTDTLVALAAEQAIPHFAAVGEMTRGWLTALQGRPEEGLRLIRRPLQMYRATGANQLLTFWLGQYAAMLGQVGEIDRAIDVSSEALDLAERSGERMYYAQILRIRGEIFLRAGTDREAEAFALLEASLGAARAQRARSLELQAAMRLARLHLEAGDPGAGYQLLAGLFDWFSEGFSTLDLREAMTLLNTLKSATEMPQTS